MIVSTAGRTLESGTGGASFPPVFEKPLTTAQGYPTRVPVPSASRVWSRHLDGYAPQFFESPRVLAQDRTKVPGGWADPSDVTRDEFLLWSKSGYTKSYHGPILHDQETGRPLNPLGRTGIAGRGLLGKWGPNHAADAVVTRISATTGFLEILLIQRDCGEWAVPGGMVDVGESPYQAAFRECEEETGLSLEGLMGVPVYEGIGDGPRMTDNAWIETAAFHFHLQENNMQFGFSPQGGASDAQDAKWCTVTPDLVRSLYANHTELVAATLAKFRCFYDGLPKPVVEQLREIPHSPLMTNLKGIRGPLGILGLTGDLPTLAHREIADKVQREKGLRAVINIPTYQNPLKGQAAASDAQRTDMIQYNVRDLQKQFVSTIETRAHGPSYTVDTLRRLKEEIGDPSVQLYLIMGADCLRDFHQWRNPEEILRLAKIVPVARTGLTDVRSDTALLASLEERFGRRFVEDVLAELVPGVSGVVSSTDARRAILAGERVVPNVDPLVVAYAQEYDIYR